MSVDFPHANILLQYNPTDCISRVVAALEQYSTYMAWQHHRDNYWKHKTLWSAGYFAASIGHMSQATIEHYIGNQG